MEIFLWANLINGGDFSSEGQKGLVPDLPELQFFSILSHAGVLSTLPRLLSVRKLFSQCACRPAPCCNLFCSNLWESPLATGEKYCTISYAFEGLWSHCILSSVWYVGETLTINEDASSGVFEHFSSDFHLGSYGCSPPMHLIWPGIWCHTSVIFFLGFWIS